MSAQMGRIVLMGSGELTATMVDVHRGLLAELPGDRKAVFLDTPAGFQLNADQISQRAVDYFDSRIQHPLSIASYKSAEGVTPYEAEQAFQVLRDANYVLIGPGSPTYTVDQLLPTPIPKALVNGVETGNCLVAASAAALTVGRFTLPVYEIYKVGQRIHWVDGMDILGHFGFNLVVIPHWNNAEGGTHDTRRCFMGESRFEDLVSLLPDGVSVLGLDEHTACILDLNTGEGRIRGIGGATFRRGDAEMSFDKGDSFPLDLLRGEAADGPWKTASPAPGPTDTALSGVDDTFWDSIHRIEAHAQTGVDRRDPEAVINALLELDQTVWKARQDLESEEAISQAREILRELIVLTGTILHPSPDQTKTLLSPLVDGMLALREGFRRQKQWAEADAVRDCLSNAGIIVEDTAQGHTWRLPAESP